jgi:thiol-disulfide isomerase/thioredoxin
MRIRLPNLLLMTVALWAGPLSVTAPRALAGPLKVGDAAPDLGAFQLEGKLPDSLKGKVILLDFWASWCDPCKESFPVMEQLARRFGLVVVAVNVDENRSDMEDFLKHNAASFTVLRDAAQKLVGRVEVPTMPSSFLIDRQGKVRFLHVGFRASDTKKLYEEEIGTLLK